ncbi:MAG TPA: DoxX family protein [Puia sp.]|jgi:putative oxidoreductase|nr:DoxX family protein [Puia sp.]
MKRFLSTAYSDNAFNVATLVLRLGFGLMICILYGFDKLMHFSNLRYVFPDPLHIGHQWSLVLVIFAEVFCGLLVALGLFTRFAALVLAFSFGVVCFLYHKGHIQPSHEGAYLYLAAFFAILMVGPGRISVDSMMGK